MDMCSAQLFNMVTISHSLSFDDWDPVDDNTNPDRIVTEEECKDYADLCIFLGADTPQECSQVINDALEFS